jgi:hypothetical protein
MLQMYSAERSCLARKHSSVDHTLSWVAAGRDGCGLMHVESDIFSRTFHKSRSLVVAVWLRQLHGSTKGRALNMRSSLIFLTLPNNPLT